MNRFAEVKDLIMSLEGDFDKFYDKKNQAAGTRVRGGMQQLKTLAQDIRTQVQEMKNSEEKQFFESLSTKKAQGLPEPFLQ